MSGELPPLTEAMMYVMRLSTFFDSLKAGTASPAEFAEAILLASAVKDTFTSYAFEYSHLQKVLETHLS